MPKINLNKRSTRRKGTNKTTALSTLTIDADREAARLGDMRSDSLTWNVMDEAIPRFGQTNKFDNKVHNIIQLTNVGTILTSGVVFNGAGIYFTASAHIPQFSQFAAVFDQYRIMTVETWLSPCFTQATIANSGAQSLYTAIDYDSVINPPAPADLMEYTNVVVGPVRNGHYRKFRPHVAGNVYAGVTPSFDNRTSPWIDCASGSVQHYGLLVGLDAQIGSNQVIVNLYTRIWIQFKNVH